MNEITKNCLWVLVGFFLWPFLALYGVGYIFSLVGEDICEKLTPVWKKIQKRLEEIKNKKAKIISLEERRNGDKK